ncbi:hypothetical protein KZP23_03205 [Echinicola marina]|uniref:hypothetical protein n=1 Tax=Echinicola marina TaxID=2859768 RepID=UPI001CF6BC34|nr:hypothetical protein [Echinicola marina]UCS94056.1 hypothetical protein KZP23_03205 [Echinicola marina]
MVYRFFLFVLGLWSFCSCNENTSSHSNPEVFCVSIEILDSLVLDYMGQVYLQDISPDGSRFLGYDLPMKRFIVFDDKGDLISELTLNGEGPGKYGDYHIGKPVFLDEESFLVLSDKGHFMYDLEGRLIKHYGPDFHGGSRFIVSSGRNTVKIGGDKVVSWLQGRSNDLGFSIERQIKSRQLEMLNLVTGEYEPIVPFPKESIFSSNAYLFHDVHTRPILASSKEELYVSFSSEPKVFTYSGVAFREPKSIVSLPFEVFHQAKGVEQEMGDGAFDITDFYYGQIRSLDYIADNRFLIGYAEGVPLDEVKSLHEQYKDDMRKFFEAIGKMNKVHLRVWDGEQLSKDLEVPQYFGQLAKVEGEELWYDVDFQKRENDYTVFYKVKLIHE